MLIHPDRLFPAEPGTRKIARTLYASLRSVPIVSPHGHTQAGWFARNQPFPNPATLLVQPDHYIFRMLYSHGVSLVDLEIDRPEPNDPRRVWRIFASHYYLFRGTPTRLWLDFAFQELFGLDVRLSEQTADLYFDAISEKLQTPQFLPRSLYDRFNLEVRRPPILRWIRWTITRPFANPSGRQGFCRPSAPTPLSILNSRASPATLPILVRRPGKTRRHGRATCMRSGRHASAFENSVPPQPITGIPPRARRISPWPKPRNFFAA